MERQQIPTKNLLIRSKAWSQHRRHISEVPLYRWACLPQLGIVFDDLRLGLREGRSSIELRWPPAKIHTWQPTSGDGLRPKNSWASRAWAIRARAQ
jgi:hypothetical protein